MGENETRFLSLSGQGFQLIRGTVMAEKKEFIRIRGARENNLKALNVDIPRNQFVVFTGLSGSGKSSLAFDTIYAEGQRRYMESLSSYARQFLGQMENRMWTASKVCRLLFRSIRNRRTGTRVPPSEP